MNKQVSPQRKSTIRNKATKLKERSNYIQETLGYTITYNSSILLLLYNDWDYMENQKLFGEQQS